MSYINLNALDFNKNSTLIDSFGRLRVSNPSTLFDAQQEYGLDTLRVCASHTTIDSANINTHYAWNQHRSKSEHQ